MTWRSVVVYWVLATAIVAQLAFTMRERGASETPDEPVVAPIVQAAAASIDSIRTETRGGALELRKEAGRWHVENPPGVSVSSDLVGAFIDTLTTIPPVEILPDAPDKLQAYGLEPPVSKVQFAAGDKALATIELGRRNPTRTAVYARRPDDKHIYLLGLNAQYYLELLYEQAAGGTDAARGNPG